MGQARLTEIREARIKKLNQLRSLGVNPYPSKFSKSFIPVSQALTRQGKEVSVVGRIRRFREHGQIIFADLVDASGQIQLLFQESLLAENYSLLKLLDVGDFLGVSGKVSTTKAGQVTIDVSFFEILAKSLRPLPDDWYGLKDGGERYRRRYLDLLLNNNLKELFRRKAVFWQSIRTFLVDRDFLEVETPVLENVFGGADANPFVTHHDALDIDLFLRISMGELWQKRLMVAGFEKTFEIGRQFRNEGVSREHLQDYSQMEFYWAYANFEDSMKLVEEMYCYAAEKTFGKLKFDIAGHQLDLGKSWQKIDYSQTILEKTGRNVSEIKDSRRIDELWKEVRKTITGPAFVVNHPVAVSPLAKRRSDKPQNVERYQVLIAGSEMGNGYSELNDPLDQSDRFRVQQEMRDKGDTEAQMFDRDFVEALEYGMPPVTGFGLSERLFSFLSDKSIRETVLFPLLKPGK
jgi:lysyl-tRNA synthetase, class II